eukprot:scaffold24734_cov61-Phaeocystis_antarctica.AAC.2
MRSSAVTSISDQELLLTSEVEAAATGVEVAAEVAAAVAAAEVAAAEVAAAEVAAAEVLAAAKGLVAKERAAKLLEQAASGSDLVACLSDWSVSTSPVGPVYCLYCGPFDAQCFEHAQPSGNPGCRSSTRNLTTLSVSSGPAGAGSSAAVSTGSAAAPAAALMYAAGTRACGSSSSSDEFKSILSMRSGGLLVDE